MIESVPIEQGPEVAAIAGQPRVANIHLAGLRLGTERADFFERLDALLEDVAGLHQYMDQGTTQVSFHVPVLPEGKDLLDRLSRLAEDHGGTLAVNTEYAAVSVVGTGILDGPAVAARAHRALAGAGVEPAALITGNLSLTFLVPHGRFEAAQNALHAAFLEAGPATPAP